MARKKDETNENTAAINFRCSPEMKSAVDDLARAFFFKDTSAFLRPIIASYVEHERDRLKEYRAARDKTKRPVVTLTYDNEETLPKLKRTGKKKQAAPTNETNGGDVT